MYRHYEEERVEIKDMSNHERFLFLTSLSIRVFSILGAIGLFIYAIASGIGNFAVIGYSLVVLGYIVSIVGIYGISYLVDTIIGVKREKESILSMRFFEVEDGTNPLDKEVEDKWLKIIFSVIAPVGYFKSSNN